MIIACKCLNVSVEIKGNINSEHNSQFAAVDDKNIEFVDKFLDEINFQKKFHSFDHSSIQIQIPELIYIRYILQELIGKNEERKWKVMECLNCNSVIHGVCEEHNQLLYNEKFVTTSEDINKIKGSDSYSPAFKIAINNELLKLNVFGYRRSDTLMSYVLALKERYQKMLMDEMKATEKRISDYREQQLKMFDNFKERTEIEYNVLVRQLSNAPDDNTNIGALSPKLANFDTPPTTPDSAPIESSPPFKQQKTVWPSTIVTSPNGKVIKSNNKVSAEDVNSKTTPLAWVPVYPKKIVNNKESADSDCLFDLEGLEDYDMNGDVQYNHMDDDDEDGELDDQLVNPIRQYTRQASLNLAKSLPISMPVAEATRSVEIDIDDDDKAEDNVDIAASIKALAKSVHGDTVFGDLPRPRFSTQI